MPRTAIIHIRVPPELKAAIVKQAALDDRSMSRWIERVLTAACSEAAKRTGKSGGR